MKPSFNIAGPCYPDEHYMLPPGPRVAPWLMLMEEGKYFTLHAGHQTGKTTCAQWLVSHFNRSQDLACIWMDIQTARDNPDPESAFRTILTKLTSAVEQHLPGTQQPNLDELLRDPGTAILRYFQQLCLQIKHPLVALIDEADCLVDKTMVSFLTQLRDGYLNRRTTPFPHSIVLIGRRQVRDYTLSQQDRRAVSWLGTSSPFNITVESATLALFSPEDVTTLLGQHTTATGQRFEPTAIQHIYDLSQGHPWLCNALADQVVRRDVPDRTVAITRQHVERAKETIILERRSHIDSLMARLREPRLLRILDPMLAGGQTAGDVLDDDIAYALGLGIVQRRRGLLEVANPIYREVIPRALTYVRQMQIRHEPAWYVCSDGSLDMPKLMAAWQEFWRVDGHLAAQGFGYRESGPHLMFMAFLQRVINHGGRIEREYGLGRGALDLLIQWKDQRHAIEIKLRRSTITEQAAMQQLARYLDTLGLSEGWLVMFDLRKTVSWKARLKNRTKKVGHCKIHLVGC